MQNYVVAIFLIYIHWDRMILYRAFFSRHKHFSGQSLHHRNALSTNKNKQETVEETYERSGRIKFIFLAFFVLIHILKLLVVKWIRYEDKELQHSKLKDDNVEMSKMHKTKWNKSNAVLANLEMYE